MDNVRRLYRSNENRMLGGVCGGLGKYFHVDPTLVRLIVVTFSLLIPILPLAYLIMWFIVPQEPQSTAANPPRVEPEEVKD